VNGAKSGRQRLAGMPACAHLWCMPALFVLGSFERLFESLNGAARRAVGVSRPHDLSRLARVLECVGSVFVKALAQHLAIAPFSRPARAISLDVSVRCDGRRLPWVGSPKGFAVSMRDSQLVLVALRPLHQCLLPRQCVPCLASSRWSSQPMLSQAEPALESEDTAPMHIRRCWAHAPVWHLRGTHINTQPTSSSTETCPHQLRRPGAHSVPSMTAWWFRGFT